MRKYNRNKYIKYSQPIQRTHFTFDSRIRKRRNWKLPIILVGIAAVIVGLFFGVQSLFKLYQSAHVQATLTVNHKYVPKTDQEKRFIDYLQQSNFIDAKNLMDQTILETEARQRTKVQSGFLILMYNFADTYIQFAQSTQFNEQTFDAKYSAFDPLFSYVKPMFVSKETELLTNYLNKKVTYDVTKSLATRIFKLDSTGAMLTDVVDRLGAIEVSVSKYAEGQIHEKAGDTALAIASYSLVTSKDTPVTAKAKERLAALKPTYFNSEFDQVKTLYNNKDYNNAYNRLSALVAIYPERSELAALVPQYYAMVPKDLVQYDGVIETVFIHPLAAFPEQAFATAGTYDSDCLDATEFKNILSALYEKGFVLVRPNDVYELKLDSDGVSRVHRKSLMLPKGKKPIIFMVDAVPYDQVKLGRGMVDKLILKNGKVMSYTKLSNGQEVTSEDNDAVPLINQFVAAHPDFSYNGAKLTLAVTGFDGLFGYKVQHDSATRAAETTQVKALISQLKQDGFAFASQSYKLGYMSKMTDASFQEDVNEWANEIQTLVGPTMLYVYPYGDRGGIWNTVSSKVQMLSKQGFRIFFGMGAKQFSGVFANGQYLSLDRACFSGLTLRTQRSNYARFFDSEKVYDTKYRRVPMS